MRSIHSPKTWISVRVTRRQHLFQEDVPFVFAQCCTNMGKIARSRSSEMFLLFWIGTDRYQVSILSVPAQ